MKELFDKESLQQNPGVDWGLLEKLRRLNEDRSAWGGPRRRKPMIWCSRSTDRQ